ncbi:MAG: sulfotransferase [Pseudomonadota bacterium]
MTTPLFVVGAGRSGTKFLMNILNNSEHVHLAPEIHYFSSLMHDGFRKNLRRKHGKKPEYRIEEVVDCLRSGRNFGTYWRRKNEFPDPEIETWFRDRRVDDKGIYEYIVRHDSVASASGKRRLRYLGEKTPSNVFHIGTLLDWFPDAVLLFMYRNPVDVLKSEVNKGFKPDYPLSKSNPLYAHGLVVYVFAVWLLAAVIALFYKARNRDSIHFISYDYMAGNVEDVAQRLAGKLDIPYLPSMCQVEKVDSSMAQAAPGNLWTPPSWIAWLYRITLFPLMAKLDRRSLHHETPNAP